MGALLRDWKYHYWAGWAFRTCDTKRNALRWAAEAKPQSQPFITELALTEPFHDTVYFEYSDVSEDEALRRLKAEVVA